MSTDTTEGKGDVTDTGQLERIWDALEGLAQRIDAIEQRDADEVHGSDAHGPEADGSATDRDEADGGATR